MSSSSKILILLFLAVLSFSQQTESFLPLQIGNSWRITNEERWVPFELSRSLTVNWKIVGDTICNDKKYYIFITNFNANEKRRYFREIENGDIVEYEPKCNAEFLLYSFSLTRLEATHFIDTVFINSVANCADNYTNRNFRAYYRPQDSVIHFNHGFFETWFQRGIGLVNWYTDFYSYNSSTIIIDGICVTCNPRVGVNNGNKIPSEFKLSQNYPNPFNPATIIRFTLPKAAFTSIKIYDILGREVKTILNEFRNSGEGEVVFNATEFAGGIYFYKIRSGNFTETKKMNLLK